MQHMLRMRTQEKVDRKKQHNETVSALSSGPKPPPPPPGGSITSETQGLRPGSSRDVDAPMSVAPEVLSNFAKTLVDHAKPLLHMEQWADE